MKQRTGCALRLGALSVCLFGATGFGEEPGEVKRRFSADDVYGLEFAADPQIAPDGSRIVYERTQVDAESDRFEGALWWIDAAGAEHREVPTEGVNPRLARWAPDSVRLAYVSGATGEVSMRILDMTTGAEAVAIELERMPLNLSWSPDGAHIAFLMEVEVPDPRWSLLEEETALGRSLNDVSLVRKTIFRDRGGESIEDRFAHIFVWDTRSGELRQLTSGAFEFWGIPSWSPDGTELLIASNLEEGWEFDLLASRVYAVDVETATIREIPVNAPIAWAPQFSPDGRSIAYLGCPEPKSRILPRARLHVRDLAGGVERQVAPDLKYTITRYGWGSDSSRVFIQYDQEGNTKIDRVMLSGERERKRVANNVGGLSLGRPLSSGTFSIARNHSLAYTHGRPNFPAEVAIVDAERDHVARLTRLNERLLSEIELAEVEKFWLESTLDGRSVQAWIVRPPEFDPDLVYPMIVQMPELPSRNYGDRFSAELQLLAASGYVVLYLNPRGSSSYGEEFEHLVADNFPGSVDADIFSAVDRVVARGFVDPKRIYVTGENDAAALCVWLLARSDRFSAAVVTSPMTNRMVSPLARNFSPLSARFRTLQTLWKWNQTMSGPVLNSAAQTTVTPTMVVCSEDSFLLYEAERYYQCLRLSGTDSVLVRFSDTMVTGTERPSAMIRKVLYSLAWFERQMKEEKPAISASESRP